MILRVGLIQSFVLRSRPLKIAHFSDVEFTVPGSVSCVIGQCWGRELDDTCAANQNATITVGESHAHDPDPEEHSRRNLRTTEAVCRPAPAQPEQRSHRLPGNRPGADATHPGPASGACARAARRTGAR